MAVLLASRCTPVLPCPRWLIEPGAAAIPLTGNSAGGWRAGHQRFPASRARSKPGAAGRLAPRGVPARLTETYTLESEWAEDVWQTELFDSLTFGGWLDYPHFNASVARSCTVGAPGCTEADDPDMLYAGGGVLGFIAGRYPGTAPTGAGSATWTGIVVGMEDLASASLWRGRPDVLRGDARVVIDDLAAPDVGVVFTNIRNVTEGTRQPDMTWEDLPLEGTKLP